MALNKIIELYRLADKPPIESGTFSARLSYTADVVDIIQSIREHPTARFDEVLVGGNEILDREELPTPGEGEEVEFTLRLPADSANKFYDSVEDLIKTSRISKGILPSEFYIVDDDYDNESSSPSPKIGNLRNLCELIHYLSKLANYHDEKTSEGYYKLIFVNYDETQPSPATVIDTKVNEEMLDFPELDTSLLHGLCSGDASTDPHYNSQIGVFSVTITTFVSSKSADQAFSYLIRNWHEFLDLYQKNLTTYLSGFGFHKAKREVAEAEFKIAEQFSKVIGDITGKLLSIPISTAALIVVVKSSSIEESSLLILGLLSAAIVISGTVDNQQRQLVRISDAKDIVLGALEGRIESYPQELAVALKTMISALKKNQDNLDILLKIFRVLSWGPALLGVFIHATIYSNWLSQIILF